MTADVLITEYVDAARALNRWLSRAKALTCELEHLHATRTRLLPAGATCDTCRKRIAAQHKADDARAERNRALREMHEWVLDKEIQEHQRNRIRVTRKEATNG